MFLILGSELKTGLHSQACFYQQIQSKKSPAILSASYSRSDGLRGLSRKPYRRQTA
jgi:hypothetical protein